MRRGSRTFLLFVIFPTYFPMICLVFHLTVRLNLTLILRPVRRLLPELLTALHLPRCKSYLTNCRSCWKRGSLDLVRPRGELLSYLSKRKMGVFVCVLITGN